ncbi:MAG: hypothetical protein LBV76_03285 [Deltaproteobacteria bacterium]|jgi:hypothetical protein|nr:hypothetical protein [Deltaproteobacteria bacterium]
MERALQKLARQLNQYDTASLTALWENYANLVMRFEPTKRWEEAALSFCMIQAVHWKNQLFNYGVRQSAKNLVEGDKETKNKLLNKLKILGATGGDKETAEPTLEHPLAGRDKEREKSVGGVQQKKRCKVLLFPPRDSNQS